MTKGDRSLRPLCCDKRLAEEEEEEETENSDSLSMGIVRSMEEEEERRGDLSLSIGISRSIDEEEEDRDDDDLLILVIAGGDGGLVDKVGGVDGAVDGCC